MELKPCPFCGCKAAIRYTRGNQDGWVSNNYFPREMSFVECKNCHAKSGKRLAENAVKAWNRRVDNG